MTRATPKVIAMPADPKARRERQLFAKWARELAAMSAGLAMPRAIPGSHHPERPDLTYKHSEKPLGKRARRRLRGKRRGR